MAARFKARAGVDLGGTKIQAVVVDGRDTVRGSARAPTPAQGGPRAVAAAIVDAVREAAREADDPPLTGVGVGSPGEVSAATGVVSQARNLPGWKGAFPLGPAVSDALGGVRVVLGNDVDVAVRGEFELGAGRPYTSVLGVWWGTGVGGGLILDGKPWTGLGSAAEIGHVVIRLDGRRCPCGRRGCMEAYAGRGAMEARARKLVTDGRKTRLFSIMKERGRDRLTSGIWERALRHGDRLAGELVDEAVGALGAGVASVCNVIDPEAVILGGGMGVRLGGDYADRIAAAMLPHLFVSDRPPPVTVAALGDLGGAIGAALLVR
ncbi:MAG: glucokinase [Solirubrobacteraceae bacterium]|nr:glucokinase [Solirubrobacteraceae bacterium]